MNERDRWTLRDAFITFGIGASLMGFALAMILTCGCSLFGHLTPESTPGMSLAECTYNEGHEPSRWLTNEDGTRIYIWEWNGSEIARGTFRDDISETKLEDAPIVIRRHRWICISWHRRYHGYEENAARVDR